MKLKDVPGLKHNVFVGLPTMTAGAMELGRRAQGASSVLATYASESEAGRGAKQLLTMRCLGERGEIDREAISWVASGEGGGRRDVERFQVREDDVLIAARSTQVRASVVPADLADAVFNSTLVVVRCGPAGQRALEPALLAAFLRHDLGQAAIDRVVRTSSNVRVVTVSSLEALEVPVPPLEIQAQLVELVRESEAAFRHALEVARRRRELALDTAVTLMFRESGS